MALERSFDPTDPLGADERTQPAEMRLERRLARSWQLATGTLACPGCDAPVAVGDAPLRPADALHCPVCSHAAPTRDFLTLGEPTRPARVDVRIVPALT
jgi:hypothetical protein